MIKKSKIVKQPYFLLTSQLTFLVVRLNLPSIDLLARSPFHRTGSTCSEGKYDELPPLITAAAAAAVTAAAAAAVTAAAAAICSPMLNHSFLTSYITRV